MNNRAATAREAKLSIARYAVFMLALFFALQCLYQTSRDSSLQRIWIDRLTVVPSAALISWLSPDEAVITQGQHLISPHVRMSVLNGCEGTEIILLLMAALFALPLSWRRKLSGILLGGLLIYGANQLRIVTLYYCLRFDRSLFDSLHGTIAPLTIIAIAAAFFLYWTRHDVAQRTA